MTAAASAPSLHPSSEDSPTAPAASLGFPCVVYATFFVFAEALATANSPYWLGWQPSEAISLALGGLVFAALISIAALLLSFLAHQVSGRRLPRDRFYFHAATFLFLAYGAILSPSAYGALGLLGFVATGFLGLVILGLLLISRASAPRLLLVCLASITALLAGILTVSVAVPFFFPNADGASRSTIISVGWAAAVVLAISLWAFRTRRTPRAGFPLILLSLIVAAVLPATFILIPLRSGDGPTDRTKPNILLLTADALRADYCSVYGGQVATPGLERLAAEGLLFEQCFSLAPWTIPSLDGMFSSKYPPSITPGADHKVQYAEAASYSQLGFYWEEDDGPSFVDKLEAEGYATAAYIGNLAMYGEEWLLDDFDETLILNYEFAERRGPLRAFPILARLIEKVVPALVPTRPLDTTKILRRIAELYLHRNHDRPFFLWIHFFDPHTPYDPPQRYRSDTGPFPYLPMLVPEPRAAEYKPYVKSLYEGEIQYVDEAVGALVDEVKRLGIENSTYICFTSDHGEELWDRLLLGHGFSMFNEQVHVPLLLSGPGLQARKIRSPVSAIDILPTLAGLLELTTEEQWRGRDLSQSLKSGEDSHLGEVSIFMQATGTSPRPAEPYQAVVWKGYKLVRGMRTGRSYLYNLADDPKEQNDVASQEPKRVEELKTILQVWSQSFPGTFAEMAQVYGTITPSEITIKNLEAMGYL